MANSTLAHPAVRETNPPKPAPTVSYVEALTEAFGFEDSSEFVQSFLRVVPEDVFWGYLVAIQRGIIRNPLNEKNQRLFTQCALVHLCATYVDMEMIQMAVDGEFFVYEATKHPQRPVYARISMIEPDLKTMPYVDYLKTDHWRTVRAGALDRAGRRCQLCNSPNHLHVHHRTYERRGCEEPADVIVLCQPCHTRFHDITDGVPLVMTEGAVR